jgi:hypothetical protein
MTHNLHTHISVVCIDVDVPWKYIFNIISFMVQYTHPLSHFEIINNDPDGPKHVALISVYVTDFDITTAYFLSNVF